MARRHLIPLIQQRIDELEAEGVDAIIVCCAEEYPPRSFRARSPFVLPYRSGLALVEAAAAELESATRRGGPNSRPGVDGTGPGDLA